MSTLNYSKWDHIEVSDDEDDTHPNIDTPSLFRWRHQARMERMAEMAQEKDKFKQGFTAHQQEREAIKQKLKAAAAKSTESAEYRELQMKMTNLDKQHADWLEKEADLQKKERLTPLNIDTICHEGKSKTVINKKEPRKEDTMTDEEKAEAQGQFFENHEKEIKKYGMFQQYNDSEKYLHENQFLVSEFTANYLVVWCINLAVEGKDSLMKHVAHQCIVMQFILELAKSLDIDPRGCVKAFFNRIKIGEKQYMDAFNDELNAFKARIKRRADERIEEAKQELEEEERQKRLGPGGLDPIEVFASLPPVLQDCFERKDIPALQEAISSMDPSEAEYHIKRCVDSGMWVPGGGAEEDNAATTAADDSTARNSEEHAGQNDNQGYVEVDTEKREGLRKRNVPQTDS